MLRRNTEYIENAANFAIASQKNIVNICKEILEKKRVKQIKNLRYAILESDQSAYMINTSFYAIDAMTNFLLRIHNETASSDPDKKKKILPFMLVIFDKQRHVYLVHATHGNVSYFYEEKMRKK